MRATVGGIRRRLIVAGVALLALIVAFAQPVVPALPAQAAGLPPGWVAETPMTPMAGGIDAGPQLHVAADGTVRYLAVTGKNNRSGSHRIWQRSPDGRVQTFALPKGMIQTVDSIYTTRSTYLGRPDASGGYLVVQYHGKYGDENLRSAYIPKGVDPSTVTASVQANGKERSPRLFLSSPSGAAALVVADGADLRVLLRPAGASSAFGAPVTVTAPGGAEAKDVLGGIIDPSGGVLLATHVQSHGTYTLRTLGQAYVKPGGSMGDVGFLQVGDDTVQQVWTQGSDNGHGLVSWLRMDDAAPNYKRAWVATRSPGALFSAPVALGNTTRSDMPATGAIADDGSAVVAYSHGDTSCDNGSPAKMPPWVATRAAGTSGWAKAARGAGSGLRYSYALAASGGKRIGALSLDTVAPVDPCAAGAPWSAGRSYRLGMTGAAQSLVAPVEIAAGAQGWGTAGIALNASGVTAALVHMATSSDVVITSQLVIVGGTAQAPKALKTATPTISGKAAVGKKLTAKAGAWTSGAKLSYQWYASGKKISKATKSSFTVTSAQRGKAITVRVTGSKAGYTTVTKASKATAKVAKGKLTAPKPTITGTAKAGKTLKVKAGKWTSGTKLSYQWYASGKKIKNATKTKYKVAEKYVGKKITVKVTGKKSGYAKATKASKATAKVKR